MRFLHMLAVTLAVVALQFSASGVLEAQTLKVPYVSLSPTAGPLWIAYEVKFALDQRGKELPDASKLNAEDFIYNGILAKLEKSGFIDQIYGESSKR